MCKHISLKKVYSNISYKIFKFYFILFFMEKSFSPKKNPLLAQAKFGSGVGDLLRGKNPFIKTPEQKAEIAERKQEKKQKYEAKKQKKQKAKQDQEEQIAKKAQAKDDSFVADLMDYIENTPPNELNFAMDTIIAREQAGDEIGLGELVKNGVADKIGYDRQKSTSENIKDGVADAVGYDREKGLVENVKKSFENTKNAILNAFDIVKHLKQAKDFFSDMLFGKKTDKWEKAQNVMNMLQDITAKGQGLIAKVSSAIGLFKKIIPPITGPITSIISSSNAIFSTALSTIIEGINMARSGVSMIDMMHNQKKLKEREKQKGAENMTNDNVDEEHLTAELIKINGKRINRGWFIASTQIGEITGSLMSLGGSITTLASGGIAAPASEALSIAGTSVGIASKATRIGASIARTGKQFVRDKTNNRAQGKKGFFNDTVGLVGHGLNVISNKAMKTNAIDTSKTSTHKRANYGQMGKSIFSLMSNFNQNPDIGKAKSIKSYIFATGVSYEKFATTKGNPDAAALMLYSAMKMRQASDKSHTDAKEMYGKNSLDTRNRIIETGK